MDKQEAEKCLLEYLVKCVRERESKSVKLSSFHGFVSQLKRTSENVYSALKKYKYTNEENVAEFVLKHPEVFKVITETNFYEGSNVVTLLRHDRACEETVTNAKNKFVPANYANSALEIPIRQQNKSEAQVLNESGIVNYLKEQIMQSKADVHMNQLVPEITSKLLNNFGKMALGDYSRPKAIIKCIYGNPKDFVIKNGFVNVLSNQDVNRDSALEQLHLDSICGDIPIEDVILKFMKGRVIEYGHIPLDRLGHHVNVLADHFNHPSISEYTQYHKIVPLCKKSSDFKILNGYVYYDRVPNAEFKIKSIGCELLSEKAENVPQDKNLVLPNVFADQMNLQTGDNRNDKINEHTLQIWFLANVKCLLQQIDS